MPEPGAAYFTTYPMLHEGLYFDGSFVEGGRINILRDWGSQNGGSLLPTLGDTDILQLRWLGGDAPVNLHPHAFDVEIELTSEADYWLIHRAQAIGAVVPVWWDYWIADLWHIPSKASGQTTWKTSRWLPWNLSGISHATRPPKAFIDGVAQTIVTSGTPTSGQVKVPATGGDFGTIETPSSISGTYLELRYPAVFLMRIQGLALTYQQVNDLRARCSLIEQRAGIYTPA